VRKRRYQGRGQLVLELEPRNRRTLAAAGTKGLVETLADLLLEALGRPEAGPDAMGGGDEQ